MFHVGTTPTSYFSPNYAGFNDARRYSTQTPALQALQTLPVPQTSTSPPYKRGSFIIPSSVNDPRPSFSFLSLDFTNPSTPQTAGGHSGTVTDGQSVGQQGIQSGSQASSHSVSQHHTINRNQSSGNINTLYQQQRRIGISETPLETLAHHQLTLRQELDELSAEMHRRCDPFSLVLDDEGGNAIKFSPDEVSNGSLLRVNCWGRDLLMDIVLTNLRKHSEFYDPNTIKPVTMVFHSSGKEQVFKDLNTQVSMVSSKFMSFSLSISQILSMLPPRDIVFFHIDHFFKLIYPFVSVLDEKTFKSNVVDVMEMKSRMTQRQTNVLLATLIVVLRLSFISTMLDVHLNGSQGDSKVMSFPINADYMLIVNAAIHHPTLLKSTSVDVMQLLILYRFYQVNAPERGDGESGNEGALMNSLLVTSGKILGFHRNLTNVNGDRKYLQLLRKIWWTVGTLDIDHALTFGRSPLIDIKSSDATEPMFDPFSSNLQNVELEKFGVDRLNKFTFFSRDINAMLRSLHDSHEPASSEVVEVQLGNIARVICESCDPTNALYRGKMFKYSSIENDLCNQVDDMRIILMFFPLKCVVEYILLTHYEQTNNVYKYVQLLQQWFGSLMYHVHKVQSIIHAMENQLCMYRLLLGPLVIESVFKVINVLIPFIVRVKLVRHQIEVYSRSLDPAPPTPRPLNYNPFMHPDPNPLHKGKISTLVEFDLKLSKLVRDQLMILKNLSVWSYKARRYYGQSKCLMDLIEKGEVLTFDKIVPGSVQWNTNLLISLDVQVISTIIAATDWTLRMPRDYEYFEDEFGVDIWGWGKVEMGSEEKDEFESIL